MKNHILYLLFCIVLLPGCKFPGEVPLHGVKRVAKVHAMPDVELLKDVIAANPEVKKIKLSEVQLGDERIYNLWYSDGGYVFGVLSFLVTAQGEVYYDHYTLSLNGDAIQKKVDNTWPIMKKIENDLIEKFNMPEIRDSLKVDVFGIEHPERKLPSPTKGNK